MISKLRDSADTRVVLYRGARRFAIILVAGLFLKFFACDSVRMGGAQMEPAVLAGDRVLILKAPYSTPVLKKIFAGENKPVVVALPGRGAGNTLLRVVALHGDTVGIDAGQFYRNGSTVTGVMKDTARYGVVPAKYSPADFMEPYRVPAPGDTITFAELPLRDLVFSCAALRQERRGIRLRAFAMVGDSIIDGYIIKDFSMYSGPIDSVPEELANDWFFWDRLREYLDMQGEDGNDRETAPQLAFSVFKGKRELKGFRVKKRYLFLLGDNWSGAKDSRYFGAVRADNVRGRAVLRLWGNGKLLGVLK
jgi:signal peptidase I